MLLLVETLSLGITPHAVCSGRNLSLFGCVAREERRLRQRRKRGCKSRHIHLAPDPSLGECLTKMGIEMRQPAVSRISPLPRAATTPLPGTRQFTLADIRLNGGRLTTLSILKARMATTTGQPWSASGKQVCLRPLADI
jgi:hypothetical protein